jgi:hypothetical protein
VDDRSSGPGGVDLAARVGRRRVEIVERVLAEHGQGMPEDLGAVAVVAVEDDGTPGDGDARFREGEPARVDRLLAVADHEQAVGPVADERRQQSQPGAGRTVP